MTREPQYPRDPEGINLSWPGAIIFALIIIFISVPVELVADWFKPMNWLMGMPD